MAVARCVLPVPGPPTSTALCASSVEAVVATLALLPVAYATSAIGLGDWALQRWQAARREHKGWRIGAACASLLVLTVLGAIPFVGWLIGLAALLAGLGALMLQARRSTSSVARPA
jgi:hypothetical protein